MNKEATIQGWVARDENGELWVYDIKPTRGDGIWSTCGGMMPIPEETSGIDWESEPKKVTIKITIDE